MHRIAPYLLLALFCGFGLTGCLVAAAGAGAIGGAAVAEETKPKTAPPVQGEVHQPPPLTE